MEIKVLGTGCSNCKALYATVEKVVKRNGYRGNSIERGRHGENSQL
jgi:hypothetical protein